MAAAAPIIVGVLGAAGLYGQERSRAEAERVAGRQRRQQTRLLAEAEQLERAEEQRAQAGLRREEQLQAQRRRMLAARGRRGTLLTGPLGIPGEPAAGGATLLGY